MDELDFVFEGPWGMSQSQDSTSTIADMRGKTTIGFRGNEAALNESFSSLGTTSSTSVKRSNRLIGPSRTRRRQKQRIASAEESYETEDEVSSTVSTSSSKDSSAPSSSLSHDRVSVVRSKNCALVRGAGSAAYAIQDAGNYQMLQDECAFLCSTILTRRHIPSKAVESTIDLVTILSSRKTRAVLWQGGQDRHDETPGVEHDMPANAQFSPVPRIWKSIFQVIAVMTHQGMGKYRRRQGKDSWGETRDDDIKEKKYVVNALPKGRTKGARRKQRELIRGGSLEDHHSSAIPAGSSSGSVKQVASLTPEMKEVLACLICFISWDCTMSDQHSIAALGSFKVPSLARRVRLSILEHGGALSGILKLMLPTSMPLPGSLNSQRPSHLLRCDGRLKVKTVKSPPRNDILSSVLFSDDHQKNLVHSATKRIDDPAKQGRMNRLKRKRLAKEAAISQATQVEPLETIRENDSTQGSDMMPPPSKRRGFTRTKAPQLSLNKDELSFTTTPPSVALSGGLSLPGPWDSDRTRTGSNPSWDDELSVASDATGTNAAISARATQKLTNLRAKVALEVLSRCNESTKVTGSLDKDVKTGLQEAFYSERMVHALDEDILPAGDYPWVTMVCLESLNRIVTGRDEGGKSCLEESESTTSRRAVEESDSDEDESTNPIIVTNRLLGQSGTISLLGKAMSQSVQAASRLIFARSHQQLDESALRKDLECCTYYQDRLSALAALIDGACLLSEANRRGFCEEDPFAFDERKEGLILHIFLFLHKCSQSDLSEVHEKRSATMLLVLRTLTSLTHDNKLATEQMTWSFSTEGSNIRGIEILAELIFRLEDPHTLSPKSDRCTLFGTSQRFHDHDMHRYDCTIFCLNTLANGVEAVGARRILAEKVVYPEMLGATSWLKWLCQWFVKQTETFREEIMSIGQEKEIQGSTNKVPSSSLEHENGTQGTKDTGEELQKHEEEMLVAAGNCCVLLACLAAEPENDMDINHESSAMIRKVIVDEMPSVKGGKSSGFSMIINTLKAFCNYYHLKLGELSLAVVAPVKKLILELEDMEIEQSFQAPDVFSLNLDYVADRSS